MFLLKIRIFLPCDFEGGGGLLLLKNANQALLSLAELTGTHYTIIRNVFVLTTNSNFASLTYFHNLHTRLCMPLMRACTDQLTLCLLMFKKFILITMPNYKKIGWEMSENLAFKGKMVRFGLDWFGLVWLFFFCVSAR